MRFLLIFLFFENVARAYDSDECKEKVYQKLIKNTTGEAGLISSTTAGGVSSVQYVSSWGPCRAITNIENQKIQFIANNDKPLMIDIAKGGGEFVYAYAQLVGCSNNLRIEYSHHLQANFKKIYGEDLENSVEVIYKKIEKVLENNLMLKNKCMNLKQI